MVKLYTRYNSNDCNENTNNNFLKGGTPLAQFVECQTFDPKIAVRISPMAQCCVLEQDTSSSLLNSGSTQENVPT